VVENDLRHDRKHGHFRYGREDDITDNRYRPG
jgi:hypothetical protein